MRNSLSVVAWWVVLPIGCTLMLPQRVFAFDYLEHLYLSDHACQQALNELLVELDEGVIRDSALQQQLTERAVALALLCPQRDARPYCAEGQKLALGALTPLSERPEEGGITASP